MSTNSSAWDQFLRLAEPNTNRECQAVVSGFMYRSGDAWASLAMTVILGPAGARIQGPSGPRIVDAQGFRAFRGIVSAEKVPPLLAGVRTGLLTPDVLPAGVDVELSTNTREGRACNYFDPTAEKRNSGRPEYPYPFHILRGRGDMVADWVTPNALAALSDALPSAEHPFGDVRGLARELDLGADFDHGSSRSIQILSPVWIGWDSVEPDIAAGRVKVRLHSFWSDVGDDLVLSVISRPGKGPAWHYRSVVGTDTWVVSREDGVTRYESELQAKCPIAPADVFLSFQRRTLDTFPIGLGTTRVFAHALFDPDFAQLRKRLNASKQNTDHFEEGVAWLLHLCGFSSARYGHKDMQGATDVVAFSEEHMAVFAECTSKLPTLEKISDLSARADAFQRRVKDARGSAAMLARAMFIGISRKDITDEFVERAHEQRVLLVANEDIQDLLDGALRGEDAVRAWGRIAHCGPRFGPMYYE
jgi:hypothetical protein